MLPCGLLAGLCYTYMELANCELAGAGRSQCQVVGQVLSPLRHHLRHLREIVPDTRHDPTDQPRAGE